MMIQARARTSSYPVRFGVKFNPNHAPAGSSEGGQFTSEGGGSGSADGDAKLPHDFPVSGESVEYTSKDGVKIYHYTSQEAADKIAESGFQLSSNSMYGKGVYFTNRETGYGSKSDVRVEVSLSAHHQLVLKDDTDVPKAVHSITGLSYIATGAREALIKAGFGSLRFPVDDENYTVVLDPGLIKVKEVKLKPKKDVLPVVKFNPNHAPGGTSEGGQFTSGEGGTGSGTSNPDEHTGHTGLKYDKEKKRWLGPDGKPVSQEIADRIKAVGVKPAYTEVALNPDPNAALQATGKDAKGRTQYMYSKEHSEAAAAEKFSRLQDFHQAVPGIRESIAKDLNNASLSASARDQAAALSLIDHTGIRVGGDKNTSADVKAYGATTLLGEHVTLGANGRIDLQFPGKSGVVNKATLNDQTLHAYLAAKDLKAGDRVFSTNAPAVREYLGKLGGDAFSPKDFRTYLGTSTAIAEIKGRPIPSNAKEYAKQRLEVARVVAAKLNNTPTVALAAYIDPSVFKLWEKKP